MKKRPIRIALTGPIGNREKAIAALNKLGFVETTDSLPWREAFPELTDEQLPGISLKGARVKEGITQKQLAEMTGIRQHHISEMENQSARSAKRMRSNSPRLWASITRCSSKH